MLSFGKLRTIHLISASVAILAGQTFERSYGGLERECAKGVTPVAGNGFLIAGAIEPAPGLTGIFLVRTDVRGDTIWTKVVIESTAERVALAAAGDASGGMLIVGKTRSQRVDWDAWAIYVDSTGNPVWSQTWGNPGSDDCALGVCPISDGGWAVCGYTLKNRQPDVNIVKLSANGALLWHVTTGTPQADYAYAIAAGPDDALVAAGTTVTAGSRFTDIYIIRLDTLGRLLWSLTVGDSLWDEARAVAIVSDKSIAVAGFTSSFGPGMDCYLIQLDSSGRMLWHKVIGRQGQHERAHALAVTATGRLVIAGESEPVIGGNADVYIAGIEPQGVVSWEQMRGRAGYDCASAISLLSDGSFAVVGETETDSTGNADFYFLCMDSLGGVGIRQDNGTRPTPPKPTPRSLITGKAESPFGSASVFSVDGRVVRTLSSKATGRDAGDACKRPLGTGVFCLVATDGRLLKVIKLR